MSIESYGGMPIIMISGMISRLRYYLSSIPTIFGQVENWPALALLIFRKRIIIRLRNGCRFRVRSLMDVWIIKETCLDRQYEQNGARIEDGWIVIDIGAGLGDFAILVAWENPQSRVYAYEPTPDSYNLLQENISINNVSNISIFMMAVGSKRGETKLFIKGDPVQYTTTQDFRANDLKCFSIEVQMITLNDIFEMNGIERCDFLKIDCEGCEFDILFGASHAILEKISRICLEYHDGFTSYNHEDLARYLRNNGFQVKLTQNPAHSHLGFLYACRL
jgi:FkbM family methyltransferase